MYCVIKLSDSVYPLAERLCYQLSNITFLCGSLLLYRLHEGNESLSKQYENWFLFSDEIISELGYYCREIVTRQYET